MKIRGHTLKYVLPWERATSMFNQNPNISIYIRESIVEILTQKNKEKSFTNYELSILNQWTKQLNTIKRTYNSYSKPTFQEFKQFVLHVYNYYNNAKNNGKITLKVANVFRECSVFIELLNNLGSLDDEMRKMQRRCIDQAIDIFEKIKPQMKIINENKFKEFQQQMSTAMNNNKNGNNCFNNNQNQKKEDNNVLFSNVDNNQSLEIKATNKQSQCNEISQRNYSHKKKGIRLKFGNKQSKGEQDIYTGPRTTKVTAIRNDPNKKCFEFLKDNKQCFSVPVQNKTIEYYTLLDNIKKVNKEGLSSLRKGRLHEAHNYIQDSLEYLNYINHY